jgi:hypothetical protein
MYKQEGSPPEPEHIDRMSDMDTTVAFGQESIVRSIWPKPPDIRQTLALSGIDPDLVLLAIANGNKIGFAHEAQFKSKSREIQEYSAFFARVSEAPAIGVTMGSGGHIGIECRDKYGEPVIGYIASMFSNMQRYGFEMDHTKSSRHNMSTTFMYAALNALGQEYHPDLKDVYIHLSSTIDSKKYAQPFGTADTMEKQLPGWLSSGLLHNTSKPYWMPYDPIGQEDIWQTNFYRVLLGDIFTAMGAFNISQEHLSMDDGIVASTANKASRYPVNTTASKMAQNFYLVAYKSAVSPTYKT